MTLKNKMKRAPRTDDAEAFVDDVGVSHVPVTDDEAESFGEEFIASATSGEFVGEDARNELSDEEMGGTLFEIRPMIEEDELEQS